MKIKYFIRNLLLILALMFTLFTELRAADIKLPEELAKLILKPGNFTEYFHFTDDFSHYVLLTADEDTLYGHPKDIAIFVLYKDDICILFCAKQNDSGWSLVGWSRQALYTSLKKNMELKITKVDTDRFQLAWTGEKFTFYCDDGKLYSKLDEAVIYNSNEEYYIKRSEDNESYLYRSDKEELQLKLPIYDSRLSWKTFIPSLFPKNFSEVMKANEIYQKISESSFLISTAKMQSSKLPKPIIICNLPSKDSEAVDSSKFHQGEYYNYYGIFDEWHFISFQNSVERSYFGYLPAQYLPLSKRERSLVSGNFINIPLSVDKDIEMTYITDDPILSQNILLCLPGSTTITALTGWNAYYIYGEVEFENRVVRGFIPIKDLKPFFQKN